MQAVSTTSAPVLRTVINYFSTAYPQDYPPVRPRSLKQRPVIPEDYPRGIVARGAGDAAAGMRAASAMVEPLQRPAIIGMAEHRARREQLIERQRAMKNIAPNQPELALQIQRREDLPAHYTCRETRGILVDGRDHEIGDLLAMVVPRSAVR